MKIIHYAIMMLHVHEQEEKKKSTFSTLTNPMQYQDSNGSMTIKFKEETIK
jgi:hypothetical protein